MLDAHAKRNVALFMLAVAAYASGCVWPMWSRAPVLAALVPLVCMAFCATLLVLRDEAGRGGTTSLLFVVAGLLWPMSHLFEWGSDALVRLSMMGSTVFWLVCAWACLLYPQQRLEAVERSYLIILGLGLGVPEIYLLWTRETYNDIPYYDVVVLVLGLGFLVAALTRLQRYGGVERRTLVPVLASGMLLAIVGGTSWFALLSSGLYTAEVNQRAVDVAHLVQGLSLIFTVPSGFIVAGLRRRFVQAAVADALARLTPGAAPEEVRQALRRALGDDRLDILYWSPDQKAYTDADGRIADPPREPETLVVIPLNTGSTERLVLLVANRQLACEAALFADSVTAPREPVLTAWSQAQSRYYHAQQRALQRRLEEARWKDRQRLGQDLHDGVQQQLYVLGTWLGLARSQANGHAVGAIIERACQQLDDTLASFRATVRGIAPRELEQFGLGAALQTLIDRQVIPVHARISPRRAAVEVEYVAYLITCEAFTNIAKYAEASEIVLHVDIRDGQLVIRIRDNGRGGAEISKGTGIAGLSDRVRSFGGNLELRSPIGRGTELVARIPCE